MASRGLDPSHSSDLSNDPGKGIAEPVQHSEGGCLEGLCGVMFATANFQVTTN